MSYLWSTFIGARPWMLSKNRIAAHGGGCRRFDGAVSLAAPRVVSMTTPGAANIMGVIRWTTLPFWHTTHPKAGWVVATGITWKTQRSIESLDVDKGRHAKYHSHGCTSKHEFIRCIWCWVTLSSDQIFYARRYLSVGYVTSHIRRGWEIIRMTSQARTRTRTRTNLFHLKNMEQCNTTSFI